MTTYASKSRKGFFNDEIFGALTILVPDPDWVRPTFDVTLQPGETFNFPGREPVVNESDAPLVIEGVPDLNAIHPQIEAINPDCRLPVDAKLVTEEMRQSLQSAPHGINWDTEPPTPKPEPALDPAQAWSAYQSQAQQALSGTDAELAGLVEALVIGEALPASAAKLVTYRRALSAITSATVGDPTLPLPKRK